MWLAWAAMAAATLSKGLIGIVIPGASLVLYTLVTRDFALWRRLHLVSGAPVYLALAAPWFIAVSRANAEFFQFFFIHEHFQRYLTTEHRRDQAWWYFVPLFLLGAMPWLPLLGWGARQMWRDGTPAANGFSWQRFASSGRSSSSSSSAPRDRSCPPTSCRCSRCWRSSPAGC